MTRLVVIICLLISSIIYQGIRVYLGYKFNANQIFDCVFWSGYALFFHWWISGE